MSVRAGRTRKRGARKPWHHYPNLVSPLMVCNAIQLRTQVEVKCVCSYYPILPGILVLQVASSVLRSVTRCTVIAFVCYLYGCRQIFKFHKNFWHAGRKKCVTHSPTPTHLSARFELATNVSKTGISSFACISSLVLSPHCQDPNIAEIRVTLRIASTYKVGLYPFESSS